MSNDSYHQPTRREILTGGLALVGLAMASPLQVLAQQTDPEYIVKFQVLDNSDIELQKRLNVPSWHLDPRGVSFPGNG